MIVHVGVKVADVHLEVALESLAGCARISWIHLFTTLVLSSAKTTTPLIGVISHSALIAAGVGPVLGPVEFELASCARNLGAIEGH